MIVTTKNFIEKSVIDVRSKGTYGWRVTGRPEDMLDTATQERVEANAVGCSIKAEPCRQAVIVISVQVLLNSTQLNSTQLNRELRTQVSDTSKSAS